MRRGPGRLCRKRLRSFSARHPARGGAARVRAREGLRKICKDILLYTILKMQFREENPRISCTARGAWIFLLRENRRFVTRTP